MWDLLRCKLFAIYSISRVWGIRSGSLSPWSSKWTVVCAKWPTPHCSANLLELGSKMHLRTPLGLWSGWFIISKYCTSMDCKLFLGEADFPHFPFFLYDPKVILTSWPPCINLRRYWWQFFSHFWIVNISHAFSEIIKVTGVSSPLSPVLQKV